MHKSNREVGVVVNVVAIVEGNFQVLQRRLAGSHFTFVLDGQRVTYVAPQSQMSHITLTMG